MNNNFYSIDLQIEKVLSSICSKLSQKIIENENNRTMALMIYSYTTRLYNYSGCSFNFYIHEEDILRAQLGMVSANVNNRNILKPITMTKEDLYYKLKHVDDSLDKADRIESLLKEINRNN